ncbi:MAG TPA: tRNA (adenosine(37)-N6)-threonylcarbamoyltransferase complex ATPase subunit type 1 TsaE [Chthoniobacterales bacterium]|nr:tRNA (adenosine(37)-N6)-threonylcarbamoyltransferase complex ATPase subunit type 1 TsaE [Chthoniobacterales bacterium]
MFISNSPAETAASGATFAAEASVGDVFGLTGDLGAGKTQFVKGFVAAIGSTAEVTSPTFTIIHEYPGGRCPVYHFDFYRLDSADAVLRLGFDDYIDADGICIVEWADRFPELFPERTRWISLVVRGETERVIS